MQLHFCENCVNYEIKMIKFEKYIKQGIILITMAVSMGSVHENIVFASGG